LSTFRTHNLITKQTDRPVTSYSKHKSHIQRRTVANRLYKAYQSTAY